MKALVLAGGLGSRLRPLTQTGAKQLLPVGNKPIIHYVMENISKAAITEVIMVVGDETAVGIQQDLQDGRQWDLHINYVHQEKPLGLAHCVLIAEEYLKQDSFAMYLGDNLIQGGIERFASSFGKSNANALTLLSKVPNPTGYGVAEFEGNRLKRLVEKPEVPPSHWAMTGIYFFDQSIFEAVHAIRPSKRNELEITDAIQWMMDNGSNVDYEFLTGWWKDTGIPHDLLEANVLVLQDLKGEVDESAMIDSESSLMGEVRIGPDVEVVRSVIRGPVIIGPNTKIEDSFIGSSTAVGAHSVIRNSEISCSVIMDGATVQDTPVRIDWSLIGKEAIVCRGEQKPKALNLILGDLSKVELV